MTASAPSWGPTTFPVIFLHGFLGQGADWEAVAAALPERYLARMPDLPGHGRHPPTLPEAPLEFGDYHQAILGWMESLPRERVRPVLVGYSLGGRAALSFACDHPERLAGLVLESASPGITEPNARQERAALDDARAARIRAAGLLDFLQEWYAAPLWRSLEAHPEKRNLLLTDRSNNDPAWMAKVIADLSPGRTPDRWPCLETLAVPTLVLAGELDRKYAEIAPQAAARLPQGRCEIIPGAGHNTHLERPEAFIGRLLPFLEIVFQH